MTAECSHLKWRLVKFRRINIKKMKYICMLLVIRNGGLKKRNYELTVSFPINPSYFFSYRFVENPGMFLPSTHDEIGWGVVSACGLWFGFVLLLTRHLNHQRWSDDVRTFREFAKAHLTTDSVSLSFMSW